jgi:lysophospholipase L1-like esterase
MAMGAVGIGAAAGAGVFGALWWLPHVRIGGSAAVDRTPPLAPVIERIVLRPGAVIACEGDSLTYGSRRGVVGLPPINGAGSPRVATPYPETLAILLGRRVMIENRGYPGDLASDGVQRWADSGPVDLAIIMYGTNDSDLRGRGHPVSIADYRARMTALVRRRIDAGARVLVLAPPPTGIPAAEIALQPYRVAARAVAVESGAAFLDPAAFVGHIAVPIQIDGVHLTAGADRAIASGLAGVIEVERSR